jgi:hypothetical protein
MEVLSEWKHTDHKKMFGGVCHLVNGNMVCGVISDFLILRLGKEEAEKALARPHVRPFDITGRPMKGWIMVSMEGFKTGKEMKDWLGMAKRFVLTLPPK